MVRPAHFDGLMREAGWRLARIATNGHHIYHHASGASLTLDADSPKYCQQYLARYARRDLRRCGKKKAG